jgi:aminoglycoside 3-N-acetyltransferase
MMFSLLPKNRKQAIRGWLKQIRRVYVRQLHSFDQKDFIVLLRRLGLKPGDVLMVHSSLDRFEGFTGKPTDIILALQEVVSPGGTILMPTLPFVGTAIDYISQAKIFDVFHSPSQMGLLTELFRRSPEVYRSVHPTHSVAAWGAKVEELIADHHLARTPCGAGSPFLRLLDHEGKLLFLGTGIRAMTFFHAVEELLAPNMPFSPFTKDSFSMQSRDSTGRVVKSRTYLFDAEWSRRRNLEKLVPVLKKRNVWIEGRVGQLDVVLLEAKDVVKACRHLSDQGVYCYDT